MCEYVPFNACLSVVCSVVSDGRVTLIDVVTITFWVPLLESALRRR